MTPQTPTFDPSELCNRKLLEMINTEYANSENKAQLEAALAELKERRVDLAKLHPGK
ncbi:MAG: hypothetical protein AB8B81_04310 [Halioglobus sp.]